MTAIDKILGIGCGDDFWRSAIEVFRFQAQRCGPYREYIGMIGAGEGEKKDVGDLPFLPIELFKTTDVYCGEVEPEKVFTSSTTGSGAPSRHLVARLADYEKTFVQGFRYFYGEPEQTSIYALLPGYLEREGSSLVYMADRLIARGGGGFYLYDTDRLLEDMQKDRRPKILLGVTYSLLDLAEKAPRLRGVTVMETGGMKGKREELTKDEIHTILCDGFSVPTVHSEYGMAELSSQAYSRGGGVFRCPPWMKVLVRDLNDPFDIREAGTGGLNVIDLANRFSCAFIQTQDIGTVYPDGSFTIMGRIDRSETRGCNLLVQ
ncbi:MAG: acyltransferase [Alistipes sp.]|nr:acyltransferase [Alistipes sp.]